LLALRLFTLKILLHTRRHTGFLEALLGLIYDTFLSIFFLLLDHIRKNQN
jgi:hypothetical protein